MDGLERSQLVHNDKMMSNGLERRSTIIKLVQIS